MTPTPPVAIVTGASRGIGEHLADALETQGYVVSPGSRDVSPVTDQEAVERLARLTGSTHLSGPVL